MPTQMSPVATVAALATTEAIPLAFTFLVLAVSMLMPAFISITRFTARVLSIVLRVVCSEAIDFARAEIFKWLIFAVAGLLGLAHAAAEPARAATKTIITVSASAQGTNLEPMIEQTMGAIKAAKKPLPAWAIELALRAYDVYKTYRNGQKVQDVQREVLAVLQAVAEIKVQVDAGREMTDREFRLTREFLDTHDARLSDLTRRVDDVERTTRALQIEVRGWRAHGAVGTVVLSPSLPTAARAAERPLRRRRERRALMSGKNGGGESRRSFFRGRPPSAGFLGSRHSHQRGARSQDVKRLRGRT